MGCIPLCNASSNTYNMYLHFSGCTSMVSKRPEQLRTGAHTWKSGILMALSTQDGKKQAASDLRIPSFTISYYVYTYYDPKILTLCMINFFAVPIVLLDKCVHGYVYKMDNIKVLLSSNFHPTIKIDTSPKLMSQSKRLHL